MRGAVIQLSGRVVTLQAVEDAESLVEEWRRAKASGFLIHVHLLSGREDWLNPDHVVRIGKP